MKKEYLDVVRLLVRVAPAVFSIPGFALKGGTAINLFVRNLPRLSVDLDLVYVDYTDERDVALANIAEAIRGMDKRATSMGLQTHIPIRQEGDEVRILIRQGRVEVKVEINQVSRGTILPVAITRLVPVARDQLKADLRLPMLAPDEIYASKLLAAMDRGHPRDWFDVMLLLQNEGITPSVRRCFVAYLAGHNRPVHETLFGSSKPLAEIYEREFDGMTADPVTVSELEETQAKIRDELPRLLDADERQFLLSLVNGEPEWSRLGIPHLAQLPAIRWKRLNLERLRKENPRKFVEQADCLAKLL